MPDEQSIIESTTGPGVPAHGAAIDDTAVRSTEPPAYAETLAYDRAAEDDRKWDEPVEDLPRRPRRRLLGAGGNPVALTLLGVLLIACGFIGGALVQKSQSTSSSSAGAAGLASRFAALRGAASGGTSATATGGASAGGAAGRAAVGGGSFGRSAGAGGAGTTAGQVAYLSGSTLYVTTAEGNTVKVTTSPTSTVTKTVKADVKGIHPGETVLVTGAPGTNGAISAESIRVGVGAGAGGGLGALLGGSGKGTTGSSGGGAAGSGSGGPALFGTGG